MAAPPSSAGAVQSRSISLCPSAVAVRLVGGAGRVVVVRHRHRDRLAGQPGAAQRQRHVLVVHVDVLDRADVEKLLVVPVCGREGQRRGSDRDRPGVIARDIDGAVARGRYAQRDGQRGTVPLAHLPLEVRRLLRKGWTLRRSVLAHGVGDDGVAGGAQPRGGHVRALARPETGRRVHDPPAPLVGCEGAEDRAALRR